MKMKRVGDVNSMFAGVCGGIAYSLGVPVWVVRVLTVMLCLSTGIGVVVYLVIVALTERYVEDPSDYKSVCEKG